MNVRDIFETMDYGPAPEDAKDARAWIEDRGGIAGHFINGTWSDLRPDFDTKNPATGEVLASVTKGTEAEVAKAVAAARKELSLRYLHLKFTKTGVQDHMLDLFEQRPADGPISIRKWIAHEYDPDVLAASFAKQTILPV